MLIDQPFAKRGLRSIKAQSRPELARDTRACHRMIFGAALGNVVQQHRPDKSPCGQCGPVRQQLMGPPVHLCRDTAFNLAQQADGAQQMFIRRIMVIHVKLHERDNAPEIGPKKRPKTPASFIRRKLRSGSFFEVKNIQKKPIGLLIGAHGRADKAGRLGDGRAAYRGEYPAHNDRPNETPE